MLSHFRREIIQKLFMLLIFQFLFCRTVFDVIIIECGLCISNPSHRNHLNELTESMTSWLMNKTNGMEIQSRTLENNFSWQSSTVIQYHGCIFFIFVFFLNYWFFMLFLGWKKTECLKNLHERKWTRIEINLWKMSDIELQNWRIMNVPISGNPWRTWRLFFTSYYWWWSKGLPLVSL